MSAEDVRAHLDEPCRQMVAARRDPVRRQPAPHRHRQAAQDRAARPVSRLCAAERLTHHKFTSVALSRADDFAWAGSQRADRPGRARARSRRAGPPVRAVRAAAEAVAALAAEWNELAATRPSPMPFAEHWFVAASLRTMAAGRDIRLIEVRRGAAADRPAARSSSPAAMRTCRSGSSAIGATTRRFSAPRWSPPARSGPSGRPRSPRSTRPIGRPACSTCAASPRTAPSIAASPAPPIVHREMRAFLESDLDPDAYYERAVRQKKRKELRRLAQPARRARPGRGAHARRPRRARRLVRCLSRARARPAGRAGRAARSPARPQTEPSSARPLAAAWDAGRLQFLPPRPRRPADRDAGQLPDPARQLLVQDRVRRGLRPLLAGRADPARQSRHPRRSATSPGWTAAPPRIIR